MNQVNLVLMDVLILTIVVLIVGLTIETCQMGIDDLFEPWVTISRNWAYIRLVLLSNYELII